MKNTVVMATHNRGKLAEFAELLAPLNLQLLTAQEAGFTQEIEETGQSYQENALIKARAVYQALGGPVLADDSGLSLDALDGYPGIYSARFAGESTAYEDKIQALWGLLRDVPQDQWTCAFHCAIAYIDREGREKVFEAEFKGRLWPEQRGQNGFGYDPVFYIPELGLCAAELSPEEKNKLSHRGQAVQLFLDWYRREAHA